MKAYIHIVHRSDYDEVWPTYWIEYRIGLYKDTTPEYQPFSEKEKILEMFQTDFGETLEEAKKWCSEHGYDEVEVIGSEW